MKHRPVSFFFLFWLLFVHAVFPASAQQISSGAADYVEEGRRLLDDGIIRIDDQLILDASDSFRKALDINARFGDAWLGLAESYYWLGERLEARDTALEAAHYLPGNVDVLLVQASIESSLGNLQEAEALYDAIRRREPYNVDAIIGPILLELAMGRTESVYANLKDLQSRYPRNRRLLLSSAIIASDMGDFEAAKIAIELALRYFPTMPEVHLLAAETAYMRDDLFQADFYGRSAVALQPRLERAWQILIAVAVEQDNIDLALSRANELVTLDPQNARYWYIRGAILGASGRTEDAVAALDRATDIQPDFDLARIALENLLILDTELEDPIRSGYADSYLHLARMYENRYLNRRAESLLRRGLRLAPFHIPLRKELADLYLQQEYRGRYLQELKVIMTIDPEDQDVADHIEAYESLLQDSVAFRWGVDQFVLDRPRLQVGTYYTSSPVLDSLPYESEHVARYIRSLLSIEEHIGRGGFDSYTQRASAIASARDNQDDYALLLETDSSDRTIIINYELILVRNGRTVTSGRVIRSGNGRIDGAAQQVHIHVADTIPRVAGVIDRQFEKILFSMGKRDDLKLEQELPVVRAGSYRPSGNGLTWDYSETSRVGTISVNALDDLLAEGQLRSQDDIVTMSVGDAVLILPPADEETSGESTESTVTDEGFQRQRNTRLLDRLLTVR